MAYTTILRNIDGAVMVAIPPGLLEKVNLSIGWRVSMSVEGGKLVIEPQAKPKYALQELLAQCDPNAPVSEEDRWWVSSGPFGRENV